MTGLGLLNEQIIAANIARYVATQFIDTVINRMAYLRVTPEVFRATLETLRAEMHAEIDRLIDEAVS